MTPRETLRTAFLISGNGTTMEAAVSASKKYPDMNIHPAVVISSRPDAPGLARARGLDVPAEVVDKGSSLLDILKKHDVELVVQTGWMPKTPPDVIDFYKGMIINQHPGRLPDFGGTGMYGARVTCATIAYFQLTGQPDFWTASTVHHVTEEIDKGDVIQATRLNIHSPGGDLYHATIHIQRRLLDVEHDNVVSVLYHFGNDSLPKPRHAQSFVNGSGKLLFQAKQIAAELFPKG